MTDKSKEIALDSKELAIVAAEAASEKKAQEIVVIDVGELLVVTDFFVICTGQNSIQVRTIADEVESKMRDIGAGKPLGREGQEDGKWVLLDYAGIVVHVFQPEDREFYRLENLWNDAERIELPAHITGPE